MNETNEHNSKQLEEKINQCEEKINTLLKESTNKIKQLESEARKTIDNRRFSKAKAAADGMLNKISDLDKLEKKLFEKYSELDERHEELKSKIDLLLGNNKKVGLIPQVESVGDSVNKIYEDSKITAAALENAHSLFYGSDANDDKGPNEGLKREIENSKITFTKWKEKEIENVKKINTNIENLKLKAEELLGFGSSVKLAFAFADERKRAEKTMAIWGVVFVISLTSMVYFSYNLVNISSYDEVYFSFLKDLPVLAPIIWLAAFAAKKYSQSERIRQEYAHKAVYASTFEGYRREIDNMKENMSGQKSVLIDGLLTALNKNVSETLDSNNHGSEHPVLYHCLKLMKEIKEMSTGIETRLKGAPNKTKDNP